MANKDLATTPVAALRLDSTSPQGHAAAAIGPGSTLRLILLAGRRRNLRVQ